MAEITSKLYDVVYPSPIPLRDLSSIAVAIEIWHLDVKQYLKIGNFEDDLYNHFKHKSRIKLRNIVPDLPSNLYQITEKYVHNLVSSSQSWLHFNYKYIFRFHRDNHNAILKDFNKIVCDYDGSIHYVRTAKRMMLCDRISQDEKFKIACAFSFEEDIMRIGRYVQSKVNLEEIDFDDCPSLYYWVCLLRNKLNKIPNEENVPNVNLMFRSISPKFHSSFEYFWELAGLRSRYQKAIELCMDDNILFCGRFILPKLNEQQLIGFVDVKGCDLVYYLLTGGTSGEIILAIWMYIKDKVNEINFATLIEKMLSDETKYVVVDDPSVKISEYDEQYNKTEKSTTCCRIWCSASDKLKQSAIKQVLPNKLISKKVWYDVKKPRQIKFLLIVLLDMSSEERIMFWHNHWLKLLCSTRAADLHRIMKLCFADNDFAISTFKKNTMAKYENLSEMVKNILETGYFEELSNILNFIFFGDEQSRKDLKQKCLQSNFLCDYGKLSINVLRQSESLHKFIDDAYGNLGSEFRNQFLSAPVTEYQLFFFMKNGFFIQVKEFVDSFASLGHNVDSLKGKFAHELRKYLIEGSVGNIQVDSLKEFLFWCLGSDDEVTKFKQTISPDEVLHNMLRKQKMRQNRRNRMVPLSYPRALDDFLLWYFDTQEKVNEFKKRFANVFEVFCPSNCRR